MTTDRQTTYRAVVGLPKSRPNGRPAKNEVRVKQSAQENEADKSLLKNKMKQRN